MINDIRDALKAFRTFLSADYDAETDTWDVDADAAKTLFNFIMRYGTAEQKRKLIDAVIGGKHDRPQTGD